MMSTLRWRKSCERMCSMLASEPVSRLSTQMTRLTAPQQLVAEVGSEESGAPGD